MLKVLAVCIVGLAVGQGAHAQVGVSVSGQDVRVGADGSVSVKSSGQDVRVGSGSQVSVGPGSSARSSVGEISPGANIEGVTIINGRLWIDGKEIPPGVKSYKSPKTGKLYRIERQGSNVSVTGND